MSDVVTAILGGHYKKKQCWINVYKSDLLSDCYVTGDKKFNSRVAALSYIPSWGLRLVYIVHVRMK